MASTAGTNYPFLTSKERDNETGLDYFLARYYSSTQGRFTSPDEFTGGPDELYYFVDDASANPTFYADLRKPQSLNKYQYAFNNPLRYVDPDGHDPEEPEPQDPKPVVPVPVPGPFPLPVPIQPLTPAQAQQLVDDVDKVADAAASAIRTEAAKQVAPVVITVGVIINTLLPGNVNPQAIPAASTPPLVQPLPVPAQMSPRPIDKPRDKGHRKGKRDHNKHTRKTPGESRPPGFKPRNPPRPQDMPPKPPKPPKGKPNEWEP